MIAKVMIKTDDLQFRHNITGTLFSIPYISLKREGNRAVVPRLRYPLFALPVVQAGFLINLLLTDHINLFE